MPFGGICIVFSPTGDFSLEG